MSKGMAAMHGYPRGPGFQWLPPQPPAPETYSSEANVRAALRFIEQRYGGGAAMSGHGVGYEGLVYPGERGYRRRRLWGRLVRLLRRAHG